MKLSPRHLKRYKDVALLFMRHGHDDVIALGDFHEASGSVTGGRAKADELASDLERLGPTFVKIGQLLSTRGDLLPPVYLDALSRLQDQVEPVPFEEIREVVESELGVKISKAFADFEPVPYASASLGQVHRATLRSGRKVAVKVQRPHIRRAIGEDLESLAEIATFMDAHTELGRRYEFCRIVDQFRGSLMRELDYLREAGNLRELGENLRAFPRLVLPRPIEGFTTSRVLTMDFIEGAKITDLSGAVKVEVDGAGLADELFRAYLQQILVDGFFHADPHPGNLLLTPDHRIAVLDLGMTGRVHQRLRDQLVHLLVGLSEGDGAQVAEAALRIGEAREATIDRTLFVSEIETLVGENKNADVASLRIGTLVLEVTQICARCGLRIPQEISLLGKAMMNLDRIGDELCPAMNPTETIRRHMEDISRQRIQKSFTSANVMGVLLETKELFGQLPARLNKIMDLAAENRLGVRVDAIDEELLVNGFQKIANRITVGLILASLIVGAALLMRVETHFRVFGYPGLAMILFLLAVAGGGWLALSILLRDHRDQRHHPPGKRHQ